MGSFKLVILVRQDLKMNKGKLSVQVSHASVEAALKTPKDILNKWLEEGMKKVVLKVEDEKELDSYRKIASSYGIKTALVKDAGRTFFKEPTVTCLAIGPDAEEKIDKVTGRLKML